MGSRGPLRQVRFWTPKLEMQRREDGSILVWQREPLPSFPRALAQKLVEWAQKSPNSVFIADRYGPGGVWRELTYAQALANAQRLGQALLDYGLSPQHPLLILSGNDIEHAQLALACLLVGVPFAPVSKAYSLVSKDHGKLKDIVDLLRPGLVFARDQAQFGDAIAAAVPAQTPKLYVHARALTKTDRTFEDLLRTTVPTKAVDRAFAAITGETIAKFLFTSGSTGSPKAVINTNRMLCANQAMIADCYAFLHDEPPVILDWAPWNHTAGGNKIFNMVLYNGGTLFIDDGSPTAEGMPKTLRNLADVAPTWYFNVPAGYDALVRALKKDKRLAVRFFSQLNMLMYGGAALPQHTCDALEELALDVTGERILVAAGLGSTETTPFALMCTFESEQAGNVGVPAKGLELKLVPVEDKYELRLRGPSITPGYWKNPELSAMAFDDEGFFSLGDAVRPADFDDPAKGYFFDGRFAENFKLATGTWVNVGQLRARLVNQFGGLLRDAVITGLNEPFLGAILFLDHSACAEFLGQPGIDYAEASRHPDILKMVRHHLSALAAKSTGSSTRITRALVASSPPDIDKGETTDKGSINQRGVRANRAQDVAKIYRGDDEVVSIDAPSAA